MTWRGDQLSRIADSEELQISTRRPDGTQRRWTPIWVVRARGRGRHPRMGGRRHRGGRETRDQRRGVPCDLSTLAWQI
jgi:hypothetical protein